MTTTVKELIDKLHEFSPEANVQILDVNSGYVYVLSDDEELSEEDFKFTDEKTAWLKVEEI